ncbi:MAG: hypothetical protein RL154_1424 [Pseudomonadota bacterium]|jgi:hypothetical protein
MNYILLILLPCFLFADTNISSIKINQNDIKKIDANANGANFRVFCIGEFAFISTTNNVGGDVKQLLNKTGGALTCDEAKKVLAK